MLACLLLRRGWGDQYILINGWNEWAEGMALEPSNAYKDHFLRIIQGTKYRKFSCVQDRLDHEDDYS